MKYALFLFIQLAVMQTVLAQSKINEAVHIIEEKTQTIEKKLKSTIPKKEFNFLREKLINCSRSIYQKMEDPKHCERTGSIKENFCKICDKEYMLRLLRYSYCFSYIYESNLCSKKTAEETECKTNASNDFQKSVGELYELMTNSCVEEKHLELSKAVEAAEKLLQEKQNSSRLKL